LCWIKTVDPANSTDLIMKNGVIGMSVYARNKTQACGYILQTPAIVK
jgi:hypothetical protein